ncbi:hypothetical protein Nepgr_016881 [Nepenthes gracilis]|uniref:Nodulin-like domain-containing protein n=1 Tax=Nepenthes gracilis TaxID=150966 RepID=A0AAD3SQI7_NEPGR|nr:hypothetical protein Nepgr_016881 [Nepenthes gracilis]
MVQLGERLKSLINSRWVVFVAAMWIQSFAGSGYLFGRISPLIKSSLDYNQRQIASLGVAKDLGASFGFFAGTLCELLPLSVALLVGAFQHLIGYGFLWLIVTHRAPSLPLWAMCILIFMASNGETYFNTAALVSCVQNFPKSRGPVVGILKGFAGLGGAISTQIFALVHTPDHASFIFMVAVGPFMVIVALMFIIRPVGGHGQDRPSDGLSFTFVYCVCLVLASYLMGIMLVQDLADLSYTFTVFFTVILFILLLLPVCIPVSMALSEEPISPLEEALLQEPQNKELASTEESDTTQVEDGKPNDVDLYEASEAQKTIAPFQAKLAQVVTEEKLQIKGKGPHRGEDFTLLQALTKADFWLIFFSLLLGSGSGLMVIDNLGQMSQSLGYENTHIFVSMISIWNFLGRLGGGYFSEIIVREHAYPRPVAMAVAQTIMAVGHFFLGMGLPGAMYVGTLFIGLGFGAHWAIVPATASELFGLKKFGALYNFLTIANPAGTLLFSGLIASYIYDLEAEKQAHPHHHQSPGIRFSFPYMLGTADEPLQCEGAICFLLTSMLMSGLCIVAVLLSLILMHRTKIVYARLYGRSRT